MLHVSVIESIGQVARYPAVGRRWTLSLAIRLASISSAVQLASVRSLIAWSSCLRGMSVYRTLSVPNGSKRSLSITSKAMLTRVSWHPVGIVP